MRVHFIPGGSTPATHARVEGPARHLAVAGHTVSAESGRFWLQEEVERGTEAIVLQHVSALGHLQVLRQCQLAGIAVVVDLDGLPTLPGQPAGDEPEGIQVQADAAAACLREADLVTVSTAALASRIRAHASHVAVVPDGFDDRAPGWREALVLRQAQREREASGETSDAGSPVWFGVTGTAQDYDNVSVCADAVNKVLGGPATFGDVRTIPADRSSTTGIVVIGDSLLQDAFVMPYERRRIVDLPDDLDAFARILAGVDVLLVPLANTAANRVASPRAAIYAAGLGVPVIATRTPATAELIQSGTSGYLADSRADWVRALRALATSAEARRSWGAALQTGAGQARALSAIVPQWEQALQAAISRRRQTRKV